MLQKCWKQDSSLSGCTVECGHAADEGCYPCICNIIIIIVIMNNGNDNDNHNNNDDSNNKSIKKKHNRAFQLMMSLVCAGQVLSLQSHMH